MIKLFNIYILKNVVCVKLITREHLNHDRDFVDSRTHD